MLNLTRTVRFCLGDQHITGRVPVDSPHAQANTFAAWPSATGLDRYYEIDVTCRGQADAVTGYFINIKHIDEAVRTWALPILIEALAQQIRTQTPAPMGHLLSAMLDAVNSELEGSVTRLRLRLTPRLILSMERSSMNQILISHEYEFSAAHRLHVPSLSDDENRQVFGKCNNPAGHGHNYRVRVVARCPIDQHGRSCDVDQLDRWVHAAIIEPWDHAHLNEDVSEFSNLNPSVENIAQQAWRRLEQASEHQPAGGELVEVTVWETGKTMCTYLGPDQQA